MAVELQPNHQRLTRKRIEVHSAAHVDQKRLEVEVFGMRLAWKPPLTPTAELPDHAEQLHTRRGERIFRSSRACRTRSTAPAWISACSRSESTVREMRGMPRRMSLKRWLPHSSSRTISKVHRPPSISSDRATEQNWPVPVMDLKLTAGRVHSEVRKMDR